MTVQTTSIVSGPFLPNGSTTTFPFTFTALATAEVQVFLLTGDDETIVDPGSYSVVLNNGSGGSIIFFAAPTSGPQLYIRSDPSFAQQISFTLEGAFLPQSIGEGLDRSALRDQYLLDGLSRAPLVPVGFVAPRMPSPAAMVNKLLAGDGNGNWLPVEPVGGGVADLSLRNDLAAPGGVGLVGGAVSAPVLAAPGAASGIGTTNGPLQPVLNALQTKQPQTISRPRDMALRQTLAGADYHFLNAGTNDIRKINGGAPMANTGLFDNTTPFTSFWMTAQYNALVFEMGRYDQTGFFHQRIVDQWAYIQTVTRTDTSAVAFTPAVLMCTTAAHNVTENIYDDCCWQAMYLMHVHQVTGDKLALAYLCETIANATTRYLDDSAGNPVIDYARSPNLAEYNYGNGTDGNGHQIGAPFKANQYGVCYAVRGSSQETTYGRISTLFQAIMAVCAAYVGKYLNYAPYTLFAEDTWTWLFAKLRTPAPADASRKAQGLYEESLVLDPAGIGTAPNVSAYLTPLQGYFGKPIRDLDSTYLGGAFAMAKLSSDLWLMTGASKYLTEAVSITNVITSPQAYGRTVGGKTLIANTRECWTTGVWMGAFARDVMTLPGASTACAQAIVDTAAYLYANNADDGYVSGDWAGPEVNPVSGRATWEADYAANVGDIGSRVQIMTTSSGLLLYLAAATIESWGAGGLPNPVSAGYDSSQALVTASDGTTTTLQVLADGLSAARKILPAGSVLRGALLAQLQMLGVLGTVLANMPPLFNADGSINPTGASWANDTVFYEAGLVGQTIKTTLDYSQDQMDALFSSAAVYPNYPATTPTNLIALPTTDPGLLGAPWNNGGLFAISSGVPAT